MDNEHKSGMTRATIMAIYVMASKMIRPRINLKGFVEIIHFTNKQDIPRTMHTYMVNIRRDLFDRAEFPLHIYTNDRQPLIFMITTSDWGRKTCTMQIAATTLLALQRTTQIAMLNQLFL